MTSDQIIVGLFMLGVLATWPCFILGALHAAEREKRRKALDTTPADSVESYSKK